MSNINCRSAAALGSVILQFLPVKNQNFSRKKYLKARHKNDIIEFCGFSAADLTTNNNKHNAEMQVVQTINTVERKGN